MKVNTQIDDEVVAGELLSNNNYARFISDGKSRILIMSPVISICGEEDGNAIWIRGHVDLTENTFKKVDHTFYPITCKP